MVRPIPVPLRLSFPSCLEREQTGRRVNLGHFPRRPVSDILVNAVPDHVVPLRLGHSIEESNDHDGHVVAANTGAGGGVGCETELTDVLTDLGEVLAFVYLEANDVDDLL